MLSTALRVTSSRAAVGRTARSLAKRMYSARLDPWASKNDNLTAIGTRSIFNEEHDQFREMCRKFLETEIKPNHDSYEANGIVPREAWLKAGELGLLAINCPEEYGGVGADKKMMVIMWEELSYALTTAPGFMLHSDITIPYINKYGTDQQKEKFLPKMATGECIGALAMTEPHAGSDFANIKTSGKKVDGGWLVNGSKVFITNGQNADVIITCVNTNPGKGAHGMSLMLVEADMEGFERGRNLRKVGLKGQDTSELFFNDVFVPDENVLGGVNEGFYRVMEELPQERLMIGIGSISAAEAIFEITRTYLKERQAFGGPLLKQQTIRHKMAEMKTSLAVGRAFADNCIERHNEGALDAATASMAKYYLSDMQGQVIDQCVQLHGGYGFMLEYPVAKAWCDARVQRIYGGSNDVMKEIIARDIAGKK